MGAKSPTNGPTAAVWPEPNPPLNHYTMKGLQMHSTQSETLMNALDHEIADAIARLRQQQGKDAALTVSLNTPQHPCFNVTSIELPTKSGEVVTIYSASAADQVRGYLSTSPSEAIYSVWEVLEGKLPPRTGYTSSKSVDPASKLWNMLTDLTTDKLLLTRLDYSDRLVDVAKQLKAVMQILLPEVALMLHTYRLVRIDISADREVALRCRVWLDRFGGVDWEAIVAAAMMSNAIPCHQYMTGELSDRIARPENAGDFLKWCCELASVADVREWHLPDFWPQALDRGWDVQWPDAIKSGYSNPVAQRVERVLAWVQGLMVRRAAAENDRRRALANLAARGVSASAIAPEILPHLAQTVIDFGGPDYKMPDWWIGLIKDAWGVNSPLTSPRAHQTPVSSGW